MRDPKQMEQAVARMQALAHRLRINILNYLISNPDSQVKDIYSGLGIEQSVCSQHLKLLRDSNVVTFMRTGKNVFYSINHSVLENTMIAIDDFFQEEEE